MDMNEEKERSYFLHSQGGQASCECCTPSEHVCSDSHKLMTQLCIWPEDHSLDIVGFLALLPLRVELVNLAGHISLVL